MSVDVSVEIDLDQIATADLLEELRHRKQFDKMEIKQLHIWELIELLEEQGCPKQIIEQLKDWDNQPICDAFKLKQWKELCEVNQ